MPNRRTLVLAVTVLALLAAIILAAAAPGPKPTVKDLTQKLWPKERIEQALRDLDQQKADGLLTPRAWSERRKMLEERRTGTYQPQALSAEDPPLNFIRNGSFEQVNRNSSANRSRWLWWGGWSWGGDYENMWEERPEFVHSGQYSARIRCTGEKGRIGINTPGLPTVPGATAYQFTYWAKGDGDNLLFVNFEEGATGSSREKIGGQWKQYTLAGKPVAGKNTYTVYFYSIGAGTIWLDDVELVPVGGTLEE